MSANLESIVFIHGLFGGPWKTFAVTSREHRKATTRNNASSQHSSITSIAFWHRPKASAGIYWPRDLLPKCIQNANVFSFGYEANVERFMSATGGNTVHRHGRNLLNALRDLLKEHGVRRRLSVAQKTPLTPLLPAFTPSYSRS